MYTSYQNKTYLSRTFYIASDLQGITLSLSPPHCQIIRIISPTL